MAAAAWLWGKCQLSMFAAERGPKAKARLNKSFLILPGSSPGHVFAKKLAPESIRGTAISSILPFALARFGKVADILRVAGLTGTLDRAYMGGPGELGIL